MRDGGAFLASASQACQQRDQTLSSLCSRARLFDSQINRFPYFLEIWTKAVLIIAKREIQFRYRILQIRNRFRLITAEPEFVQICGLSDEACIFLTKLNPDWFHYPKTPVPESTNQDFCRSCGIRYHHFKR